MANGLAVGVSLIVCMTIADLMLRCQDQCMDYILSAVFNTDLRIGIAVHGRML